MLYVISEVSRAISSRSRADGGVLYKDSIFSELVSNIDDKPDWRLCEYVASGTTINFN